MNRFDEDLYCLWEGVRLDYWDINTEIQRVRMHIFADLNANVSLEEKCSRIETWERKILEYNGIMEQGVLPRPDAVEFETNKKGLMTLLHDLEFSQEGNHFVLPWEKLHKTAIEGRILSTWKKLKNL